VGTFSSGGCLDTTATVIQGFKPVWGTEVCESKQKLWSTLTGTPDLGDTFAVQWKDQIVPNLLIPGQMCIDYSSSGPRTGELVTTGWMFVEPSTPILALQPDSFCLEMVANCIKIDRGKAVKKLIKRLRDKYVVTQRILRRFALMPPSP